MGVSKKSGDVVAILSGISILGSGNRQKLSKCATINVIFDKVPDIQLGVA